MNFFAKLETEYFENYLNLIKTTIENDSKKIEERFQAIKDSGEEPFTTDEGYEYNPYGELEDEMFSLQGMEQLMYKTYLIGILVFIEDQINNVCTSIEREDKLIFSYKDLKGSGVSRSIKYLETVIRKDFLADLETRKHFEIAREIRNSLVHQDGRIDKDYIKKIEAYITEYPNMLSIEYTYKIQITYNYAKSLINLSKKINSELGIYDKSFWNLN
ncbi:MAG: hypothetical protein NTV03_00410 [Candidatus Nomurabacteria bacterium]|nr:hypothetical protein [Candidatus Nomurabacteria bacterium]